MASVNEAVQRLTIESRTQGVVESRDQVKQLTQAQNDYAASAPRIVTATGNMEKALLSHQKTLQLTDQSTRQLSAANDNATSSWKAANDNVAGAGKSFLSTAESIVTTTGHLKLVALAAYALSPAFRGVANSGIAATIGLIGPAAASAAGSILSVLSPALSFFMRIAIPIGIVVGMVEALIAIFKLGSDKIKEFGEISDKAFSAGIGTDFFQRQTKAAEELSLSMDGVIKKFNEISAPKLGGSDFAQRLDKLVDAGNFKGNPGVAAYDSATSTEQRWRAVVELITTAIDKGERLAAIDLAAKFLPPELVDRLRANGNLLQEMQDKADEIKPVDIISQEQIGQAADLKKRLDDAKEKIDEFLKVQIDLTGAGLQMQGAWVSIVEVVGSAADAANRFFGWISKAQTAANNFGNSSFWDYYNKGVKYLGLDFKLPGSVDIPGVTPGSTSSVNTTTGAGNTPVPKNAAELALRQINEQKPDISKNPETARAGADEFGKLAASIERATAAQEANVLTVGKSVGEQVRMRTEFRLTEAAQQDIVKNGGNIDDYSARIKKLADRAAEAAQAFAQLTAQKKAQFDLDTVFLSDIDKQIASVQQSLHGDGWRSFMNDGLAATMRLTSALNEFSNTSRDALKGMASEIRTSMQAGATFADALQKAAVNALNRISDKLMQMAIDNLWANAFGGSTGGGFGGILGSLFGGGGGGANYSGVSSGQSAFWASGNVGPSMSALGNVFDQGRMIHPYALGGIMSDIVTHPTMFPMANGAGLMGEAGQEAIMPLKRGPDGRLGVSGQGGGNSGPSHMTISVSVDVSGANGDKAVNDIAQAATAHGVKMALAQVPGLAVSSVVDATSRGLRLHS